MSFDWLEKDLTLGLWYTYVPSFKVQDFSTSGDRFQFLQARLTLEREWGHNNFKDQFLSFIRAIQSQ